jgi:hypothetical protein
LPALFRPLLVHERVAGAVLDAGDIQTVGSIGERLSELLGSSDVVIALGLDFLGADQWSVFVSAVKGDAFAA